MNQPFLAPGDPRLFQPTPPVEAAEIGTPSLQADIHRLYEIAGFHQTNRTKPVMVGLAAPQVGIAKRLILIDQAADGHGSSGDLRLIINPVVSHRSAETEEWYEGCYSTGPICGVVARPADVTLSGLGEQGQPVSYDLHGYTARIALHELDHLDGRFFIDLVTDDAKLHEVKDTDYPAYRDDEGWRQWPHRYERSRWEALKQQASRPQA